jgi:integrase
MSTISERTVADLPRPPKGNKLHYFSGATLQGKKAPSGFAVRVTSAGTKSFVWFHRVDGRPHLETLGRWDENRKGGDLTVLAAIVAAQARAKAVRNGDGDARPARTRRMQDGSKVEGLNVAGMLDMFIERYAKKEKKLRSADQYENAFDRLVKPDIGNYGIYELRRAHVVSMLDDIADERGLVMADRTLAYFRKACNWYALRDDQFSSPIVPGMARNDSETRERVLDDDEIRDLWAALEIVQDVPACYPRFVKSILLCATRRNEAAQMHSTEIDGDIWVIPGERYKRLPKHRACDHVIPLTAAARELLGEKPTAKRNSWFIFSTTDGEKPFSGFSKSKRELDKAIEKIRKQKGLEAMPAFRLHDLRRTARTLMSRAGVPADHAERCLGHIIGGVRGVYDRHEYLEEKKKAFEALETLVTQILNPVPNVTQLADRKRAGG